MGEVRIRRFTRLSGGLAEPNGLSREVDVMEGWTSGLATDPGEGSGFKGLKTAGTSLPVELAAGRWTSSPNEGRKLSGVFALSRRLSLSISAQRIAMHILNGNSHSNGASV